MKGRLQCPIKIIKFFVKSSYQMANFAVSSCNQLSNFRISPLLPPTAYSWGLFYYYFFFPWPTEEFHNFFQATKLTNFAIFSCDRSVNFIIFLPSGPADEFCDCFPHKWWNNFAFFFFYHNRLTNFRILSSYWLANFAVFLWPIGEYLYFPPQLTGEIRMFFSMID